MDVSTIILMLAIGSFVFGLLLIAFQYRKIGTQRVPFWVLAKFLQGFGSFILYKQKNAYDFFTIMLGFNVLLIGCAYEAWAIRIISNKKVNRQLHLLVSGIIILICMLTILLTPHKRMATLFLLQSCFYFLPSWFLYSSQNAKSNLHWYLIISYFAIGILFFLCSVMFFIFRLDNLPWYSNIVMQTLPVASFCMFLISGFIMLMLAKERSDLQLQDVRNTLKRSKIQFQNIVETAIEGIFTFDKNYKITFANQNMANMLGYTIEEIKGMYLAQLIPEEELINHERQICCMAEKRDAIYERSLLRKDGQSIWFLASEKAIIDDNGNVEGSFAMLTDIDQRKKMELLLEATNQQLAELTRRDGLTGISNRRCFDEVLNHEYFRLKRSNSKLSVILLDIDYFKYFNDCYGHVKGDECLRQIGSTIANFTNRSVDLTARYGGEEFACILPDTDIEGAVTIAENIREGIEALAIPHRDSKVSKYVTASFGVTTVTYQEGFSVVDIVTKVDKLLYKAKDLGRNRVEFKEP